MTKAGDKLKQGLKEALTMTKLMKDNEALRLNIAKLREALRPFAKAGSGIGAMTADPEDVMCFHVRELLKAAEAIRETSNG